jgi:hypothetical protein
MVQLLLLHADFPQPGLQGVLLDGSPQVGSLFAPPEALLVNPDVGLLVFLFAQRVLILGRVEELGIFEVGKAKDGQ